MFEGGGEEKKEVARMILIAMPDNDRNRKVMVPEYVALELVGAGLLEEVMEGDDLKLHWSPLIPLNIAQEELVSLLPEGPQKRILSKKFYTNSQDVSAAHASWANLSCARDLSHSLAAAADNSELAQVPGDSEKSAPATDTSELANVLADLKALFKSVSSGAPRTELQQLELVSTFAEWSAPEKWKDLLRKPFPLSKSVVRIFDVEFDDFMKVRRLSNDTRELYMQAFSRFCSMFKVVDGSELNRQNIILNVFKGDLFQQVTRMPLMSDEYGWTRQMVNALGHFAVMSKLKLQASGDTNGASAIEHFIEGHLKPWSYNCSTAQKIAGQRKYAADAELIAKYHKPAILKKVAVSQYMDLMTIWHAVCVEKTHQLTPMILFKATSCVVQGFYTNGTPGRSMQIETLPMKTVIDFLAKELAEWFDYDKYKTADTYGRAGFWVCAANREAMRLYYDILQMDEDLAKDIEPEELCFFQKPGRF